MVRISIKNNIQHPSKTLRTLWMEGSSCTSGNSYGYNSGVLALVALLVLLMDALSALLLVCTSENIFDSTFDMLCYLQDLLDL